MTDVDGIAAMRAKLADDSAAARAYWPEGTTGRAWAEAGISLRQLGIEVLVATRIPEIVDWLGRQMSR